jgi:hypothetical protein
MGPDSGGNRKRTYLVDLGMSPLTLWYLHNNCLGSDIIYGEGDLASGKNISS